MKETPILMSAEMIKATLEGKKSVTRRTYGLEKVNANPDEWEYRGILDSSPQWHIFKHIPTETCLNVKCPYGQAGDLLWFKETWTIDAYTYKEEAWVIYKASDLNVKLEVPWNDWLETHTKYGGSNVSDKWRSGRFMPKWACRIKREIKSIRAERLQDITEDDAKLEGVNGYLLSKLSGGNDYRAFREYHHEAWPLVDHADMDEIVRFIAPNLGYAAFQSRNPKCKSGSLNIPAKDVFNYIGSIEPNHKRVFEILWDSMNGKKYPWSSNCWVWPIEFERIE
jgi:hypothetical protein